MSKVFHFTLVYKCELIPAVVDSNSELVTKTTLVKKTNYLVKLPTKVDGRDLILKQY